MDSEQHDKVPLTTTILAQYMHQVQPAGRFTNLVSLILLRTFLLLLTQTKTMPFASTSSYSGSMTSKEELCGMKIEWKLSRVLQGS